MFILLLAFRPSHKQHQEITEKKQKKKKRNNRDEEQKEEKEKTPAETSISAQAKWNVLRVAANDQNNP